MSARAVWEPSVALSSGRHREHKGQGPDTSGHEMWHRLCWAHPPWGSQHHHSILPVSTGRDATGSCHLCWRSVLLNTIIPAATTKESCGGGETGINSEQIPSQSQENLPSMRRSWDEPPLWRGKTPQSLGRTTAGTLSRAGDIFCAAGSCLLLLTPKVSPVPLPCAPKHQPQHWDGIQGWGGMG